MLAGHVFLTHWAISPVHATTGLELYNTKLYREGSILGLYRGLHARKMDGPETAICTLERQKARLPIQRVIWYILRVLHHGWKPRKIPGQLQTCSLLQGWRCCSLMLRTRQKACRHTRHLLSAFHCGSHTLEAADQLSENLPSARYPTGPSSQNTTLTDTQLSSVSPKHLLIH